MPSAGDIYSTVHTGIDAVNRLSVDEGGGAVIVSLSSDVTYDEAGAAWQAALNAHASLSYSYLASYEDDLGLTLASSQNVDWEWLDDAAAYYGRSSATESASRGISADQQPEGAVAGTTLACLPVRDGAQTKIRRYRRGRAVATGYGRHSLWDIEAIVTESQKEAIEAGYLAAGVLRVYQSSDATAYSPTNPDGYIEGSVYSVDTARPRGGAHESFWEITIRLAVPHG